MDARLIPASGVTGDHFEGRTANSNLGADALWSTQLTGNSNADFVFTAEGKLDAPAGGRALATFDNKTLGQGESFLSAVDVKFTSAGVGAGIVFGFQDSGNFFKFQLLDGDSAVGGANKDVRLIQMLDGVATNLVQVDDLENIDRNEAYRLVVDFDALDSIAELLILNEHGIPYFESDFTVAHDLAGSKFGISTWLSHSAEFGRFDLMIASAVPEPNAALILVIAGLAGWSRRRR